MCLICYLEFYILVFLSKVTVLSLLSKVTLVVESHQLVVFKDFQPISIDEFIRCKLER